MSESCPKSPNGDHQYVALEEGLYDVMMMCDWCKKVIQD